jgi:hypothetical protein
MKWFGTDSKPESVEFVMTKLELNPGDLIVMKARKPIREEVVQQIRKTFRDLGLSNKVIVLEDLDIGVMSSEELRKRASD